MQAVILAAGMGKRLRDLTENNTKCMVKVNEIPLIDRMLSILSGYDLSRIVIVVGYQAENLKTHIRSLPCSIPIEFVENPIYDKTNNIYSLALAQQYLAAEDTVLLESDLIFEPRLLDKILNSKDKNVALVAKYESWMDGTVVRLDSKNRIVSFIPKSGFRYSDINTYYKTVNIYKFSKEFSRNYYIPFLQAYMQTQGKNEYYEQVLRILTFLDQTDFKALPLDDEKWYEIDDAQDLDIAEAIFAENKQRLTKYFKRYGGYWRFPQMLDYCYLVNPYFPPDRMKDELRSNFDVLLTEYPSGSGINNLLAGKYFSIKQSLIAVGNGAAELIRSLMRFTTGKLGVILPTFEEYPNRYNKEDLVVFKPETDGFTYSADDLMDFYADKQISSLLIVNPDNPSGNFIKIEDLMRLLSWCKSRDIRIIIDESFVDFSDFSEQTLLVNQILENNPHLVVIKSISKSYGVPGLRLGIMATADSDLLTQVKGDLPIWNINSFAEFYMQIFSKYEKLYHEGCRLFCEERKRFKAELQKVPFLKVYPSQANYFLCEVTGKYTSPELTEKLLEQNILIKDCSTKVAFDGRNFIRIAIRNRQDNTNLCKKLNSLPEK
ncbi:MAG: aminotransferase class I/II-fold pyridoxal phosphate-dependent enzyme [Lentisphaerae bacterium]|nr:aminotransferase class I/II-fold pyridoxal phosphate-dependent enzyme [Lentisphaerota bacterium]